jgi:hypothetical protein
VWLEITEEEGIAGYLRNQTIKRSDLAFIIDSDYDDPFFRREDSVSENARKFVEDFDTYSILMTTNFFDDAASEKLSIHYNPPEEENG